MNNYTQLARRTVEAYAKTGAIISAPQDLPEDFYNEKKGIFVSIFKKECDKKCLRGCVGTFMSTKANVAEEIIQNAIWASQKDNRFCPVAADELDGLSYEVSLLNEPEQVYSDRDLDPKKYGVIVRTEDGRCGLLLPNLEGIDSPLSQIRIAAQKGCIDSMCEEFSLFRFTVTKYEE